jgi:hypothetical protein
VPEVCKAYNETLVLEQIYQCLPVDLVIWLRDRKPKNIEELVDFVELHRQARGLTQHTALQGKHVSKDIAAAKPVVIATAGEKKSSGNQSNTQSTDRSKK